MDYIQSVAAILMWFKFIYFLRVHEKTGWLVGMLIEVVNDMSSFMVVYFVALIAFADAYYALAES